MLEHVLHLGITSSCRLVASQNGLEISGFMGVGMGFVYFVAMG